MATTTIKWHKDLNFDMVSIYDDFVLPKQLLTHYFVKWCIEYLHNFEELIRYDPKLFDHPDYHKLSKLYEDDEFPDKYYIVIDQYTGLVSQILNLDHYFDDDRLIPIVISHCTDGFNLNNNTKMIITKYEPDINILNKNEVRHSITLAALLCNHPNFVNSNLIVDYIPKDMKNFYFIIENKNTGMETMILYKERYERDQLKIASLHMMKSLKILAFSDTSGNNIKEILQSLFIEGDDLDTLELHILTKRLKELSLMCLKTKTSFEDTVSKPTDGGVEETKSDD